MIELTSDEAEELQSIFGQLPFDLRMEIVETEAHDLRITLRKSSLRKF